MATDPFHSLVYKINIIQNMFNIYRNYIVNLTLDCQICYQSSPIKDNSFTQHNRLIQIVKYN